MKRFFFLTLALFSVVAAAPPAFAQLRVLFSFDETGHRVHKVVRLQSQSPYLPLPGDATPVPPSMSSATIALQPGEATLVWKDARLEVIDITQVPDPRVVHSPAHIAGLNASRVGSVTGAWLVDAPDNAQHVVILLPANPDLQLASEQWPLWLEP